MGAHRKKNKQTNKPNKKKATVILGVRRGGGGEYRRLFFCHFPLLLGVCSYLQAFYWGGGAITKK